MKKFAIAALAGALTLPIGFAAQTSTPAQGSTAPAKTKTKKHHAKKHTHKKGAAASTSTAPAK